MTVHANWEPDVLAAVALMTPIGYPDPPETTADSLAAAASEAFHSMGQAAARAGARVDWPTVRLSMDVNEEGNVLWLRLEADALRPTTTEETRR